jgi:hypothetical protein
MKYLSVYLRLLFSLLFYSTAGAMWVGILGVAKHPFWQGCIVFSTGILVEILWELQNIKKP